MTNIKSRIDALTPEQRALLEERLREKKAALTKQIQAVPRSANQQFPLSFSQERFWIFYNMDPSATIYNIPGVVRIKAQVDVQALERAINEIVYRHEILRVTFKTVDGQVVQQVQPTVHIPLKFIEIADQPHAKQEQLVTQLVQEATQQLFDLTTGPLLRALLIRCSNEDVLVVDFHHIVSDDWSAGIFVNELMILSQSFATGVSLALPELGIQYLDYAVWQRDQMQTPRMEEQLAYWQQHLANAPALLALPTDHARPLIQSFQGARETSTLPASLLTAVKQLSQSQGTTLFMTVLAIFKTMLYRYTGQDDLLIGTTITNRTQVELEKLIGCFVNTLVLRTIVEGELSFSDVLARVKQTALNGYKHSEVPFEKLVQIVRPERNTSYTPLFQVAFVLQDPMEMHKKLPQGISVVNEFDSGDAKFDLALEIDEVNDELVMTLVYATALFEQATIQRMLAHLRTLIESVVADPHQRISELQMLTFAERYQLLELWNSTEQLYDRESFHSIHQYIEEQVAKTPNKLALIAPDGDLTYQELNQQANQLAHYLIEVHGIQPEHQVGICLERTSCLVVAILAVWKTGAAYIPLDPDYPDERMQFVLQDSDIRCVLSTSQLKISSLPNDIERVDIDAIRETYSGYDAHNPEVALQADHLAYMIYTSGTTGVPKAVMVEQQNLINVILASQTAFDFRANDVMPCIAPFPFDIFLFELLNPLVVGATALLVKQTEILDLPKLIKLLEPATMIHMVPSLMRQFIQALESQPISTYPALKRMFIGGDAVPPDLLQQMHALFPSAKINILYGPTEGTIICATHLVKADEVIDTNLIGKPLSNLLLRIYDAQQQIVPIGVWGELYIGGAGVTRGYFNRPELNAAKFIILDDQRWYRTGDLVRYKANGTIEFGGRIDHQVKIRGFRVELGEIEATLLQHSAVREAIVIARDDLDGADKRLVAYLVLDESTTVTTSDLHLFAQKQLPYYMVPAIFMVLDALPLTRNGKVDRKSLPLPDRQRPELQSQFVEPTTDLEQALAIIWSTTLGKETIGIHDNFFELGGDSILSLQIVAKANAQGINITSKHMFQYQTIAQLAQVADSAPQIDAEQGLITGQAPLLPIQKAFLYQEQPHPEHFNQSMMFRVTEQRIEPTLLQEVAEHLVMYHDALRLRFRHTDDGWIQVHEEMPVSISFEWIDLSLRPLDEQQVVRMSKVEQAQTLFNLETGPLMHWVFFDGGVDDSYLLISLHHLVFDGVSWRTLLHDLQMAYYQRLNNQAIKLPPKTTSFKAWGEYLTSYAKTKACLSEQAFWQQQYDPTAYNLPCDHVQGKNTVGVSDSVHAELTSAETERLLSTVPTEYHARIDELLLSALARTIAHWTQEDLVAIELESHGRAEELFEQVSLARTIGWFTTTYPLLLQVDRHTPAQETLRSTKEYMRQIKHQGISYGLLMYLDAESTLSQGAHPPIRFNYLGQFGQAESSEQPALFMFTDHPVGLLQHPDQKRMNMIDINILVVGGQLRIQWSYSREMYHSSTIDQLAQSYIQELRILLDGDQTSNTSAYSPSDFPMANLDQDKLHLIMKKLK